MGDITSSNKQTFEEKVQFFQHIQDSHFGPLSIFRLKEPPYEYLMLFEKTFMPQDNRLPKYKNSIDLIKEKEHKNCAKIHIVQQKQTVNMCIKDKKIGVYCSYYNFTIRNAIDKKKYKQLKFSQADLLYTMWSLLDLAVYLRKFGISYGDYRSQRIFLSPEGYIKLYLLQVQHQNKHTAFYQALASNSLIQKLILSPQQLSYISDMKNNINVDEYKSDLFRIGMVIIQMMTLDQIKFYYNEERTGYKMGRINFELSSMNLEYSAQFLGIIKKCLTENPNERISLEQAFSMTDILRKNSANIGHCIRLNDDDDSNKKRKPLTSIKGQYILSGIQKKLAPSPITSMMSSVSPLGLQNRNPSK